MNDYNDDRSMSVEDLEEFDGMFTDFEDFDEDNSRIIMEMLECIDLE